MKQKPLFDNIVIKEDGVSKALSNNLIYVPETVDKDTMKKGKIVAIGEGMASKDGNIIPLSVKVGDTVLFHHGVGNTINIDGDEFIIMRESQIVGVIDGV